MATQSGADLLPQNNLRDVSQQRRNFGQHALHVRLLQVLVQMRFALPVFAKEKIARTIQRLVQIVIDAPGIFAARGKQREQLSTDFRFPAGSRFDCRLDSDGLSTHKFARVYRQRGGWANSHSRTASLSSLTLLQSALAGYFHAGMQYCCPGKLRWITAGAQRFARGGQARALFGSSALAGLFPGALVGNGNGG